MRIAESRQKADPPKFRQKRTAYDGSGKVPIQAFPFALGLGCVCLESDSHHPISQSSDSHTVISAAASQRAKYPQPVMPLLAVAYFPPDSDLSTTSLFASASPAMWNIVVYIMIWYFPHASAMRDVDCV